MIFSLHRSNPLYTARTLADPNRTRQEKDEHGLDPRHQARDPAYRPWAGLPKSSPSSTIPSSPSFAESQSMGPVVLVRLPIAIRSSPPPANTLCFCISRHEVMSSTNPASPAGPYSGLRLGLSSVSPCSFDPTSLKCSFVASPRVPHNP